MPKNETLLVDDPPSGTEENPSFINKFPVCDLREEFERVALDLSSATEDTADSGLGCFTVSGPDALESEESSSGVWGWTESGEDDSGSEDYLTADEDADSVCPTDSSRGLCTPERERLNQTTSWSCEEENVSRSESSCSSYKSTHSTSERPEEFQLRTFLADEFPSKLDAEVLLAVTGTDIDEQLFPCISRWRNIVCSYSESQRLRWPSVTVAIRQTESQTSTPRRLTHSWLTGSPTFLSMNKSIPASYVYNNSPNKH